VSADKPKQQKQKAKRSAGRRRNYGPQPNEVGVRRLVPNYWANWLGTILFGVVGVSFLCWGVYYMTAAQISNGIVALGLAAALGYMVYLFGSTRLRD
jgi:hypothetical protein